MTIADALTNAINLHNSTIDTASRNYRMTGLQRFTPDQLDVLAIALNLPMDWKESILFTQAKMY